MKQFQCNVRAILFTFNANKTLKGSFYIKLSTCIALLYNIKEQSLLLLNNALKLSRSCCFINLLYWKLFQKDLIKIF